jgi:PAS domain S-box-containing protein
MNEGIGSVDPDGYIIYVNNKLCEMFGMPREEILGMHCFEFLDDENQQIFRNQGGRYKKGKSGPYEIIWTGKDGQKLYTIVSPHATFDAEGKFTGSSAVVTDLTEIKRMQQEKEELKEKLNRSKKMEALGLLAGGVAHDLNNILSGIVSYPEVILMNLPQDSPLRRSLTIIQQSGQKAADVVQDLITVARGVASPRTVLNPKTVIENYLSSPEYKKLKTLHPLLSIEMKTDPDILNISASSFHLEKVLMNLVSNAAEAISDRGLITISAKNQYIDTPIKGYDDVRKGEYVVISVSDTGPGISPEDMDRIFEPFYTKKIMGRSGTGLGLTIVWSTIQDHGGYIDIKSGKNGTTFDLYIPITREGISGAEKNFSFEEYKGNGEKILVVDDETSQREIACSMLFELGYQTAAVASGEEAVEYSKQHKSDLIVLDMIMEPNMNGLETYRELLKIHPSQKAIIASGYAETSDVKEAHKLGAGQYIRKPYTMEKIGMAIRKELSL